MSSTSSSPSSSVSAWHHPHLTCGAWRGPALETATEPSLDPAWKHQVMDTEADSNHYQQRYGEKVKQIFEGVEEHSKAYERLEHLCTEFGSRLSGSDALERAIDWCERTMRDDGLENVRTEQVMVPNWVRGEARCEVLVEDMNGVFERRIPVSVLAIGLSCGTVPVDEARAIAAATSNSNSSSNAGNTLNSSTFLPHIPSSHIITAPLLVVSTFDELDAMLRKDPNVARDKILLFNARFTNYGETVKYRGIGAQRGDEVGARAVLVRSVAPISLYTPHTGSMADAKTPVACCTMEDAELLHRLQQKGKRLTCSFYSSCHLNPDRPSRNLLAEYRGSERPDELVVVGAHIDSWDVGSGAHDDGQGCMIAWEVVRILKAMAVRPRRTIRVVLFTDEEVRSSGADAYAKSHAHEMAQVQAALETDLGCFPSNGFGFTGPSETRRMVQQLSDVLKPYGASKLGHAGPGVDVRPLSAEGVPALLLWFDDEWCMRDYFAFHHTAADTFDKIDPKMMQQNLQVLAAMTYMLADIPECLPHALPTPMPNKHKLPPTTNAALDATSSVDHDNDKQQ